MAGKLLVKARTASQQQLTRTLSHESVNDPHPFPSHTLPFLSDTTVNITLRHIIQQRGGGGTKKEKMEPIC